jgi:hypothetical protein
MPFCNASDTSKVIVLLFHHRLAASAAREYWVQVKEREEETRKSGNMTVF